MSIALERMLNQVSLAAIHEHQAVRARLVIYMLSVLWGNE